jgi:hypothetical protein
MYNVLVKVFNLSTVLLVASVAFAILFSFPTSAVLGGMGLFIRWAASQELHKYTLPPPPQPQGAVGHVVNVALAAIGMDDSPNRLRHALNEATLEEKAANIFVRVRMPKPNNWEAYQVYVFDHIVWMNQVPIPEAPGASAQPNTPG